MIIKLGNIEAICVFRKEKTLIKQYLLASKNEIICELLTRTLNIGGHILFLLS
jgi:hypothetical protein